MFFIKGSTALQYSYFGHDQSPLIFTNVQCSLNGNYNSLLQSSYFDFVATTNCGDSTVASVVCIGNTLLF